MKRNCLIVLTGCSVVLLSSRALAADNPLVGEPVVLSNMELVWSLSTRTNRFPTSVAPDPIKGVVYTVEPHRPDKKLWVTEITLNGKLEREFSMKKWNGRVRSARLRDKGTRELVTYPPSWVGSGVVASDTDGNILWTHPPSNGLNDLWVADLDGDGLDEVIVGYNGSIGLHVLAGTGELLWKNQEIKNVWSVCAADLDGDGKAEVIGTSAIGKVHVFKGDGTRMADIAPPPGYYADGVRPLKLSVSDRAEGILVTGGKGRIAALKGDGTLAWHAPIGTGPGGRGIEPAPGKPWLAVSSGAGGVVVLDTRTGKTIANAKTLGEVCWLEVKGQGSPLLIVSTSQTVEAYRIKEQP